VGAESESTAPVRYEGGVRLEGRPLWFDPLEKKPFAILSSALSAPLIVHERTVLHPATLEAHPRRRAHQAFLTADYGQRLLLGPADITLHPAGVCPGSAQVLVEDGGRRLLYVGPFCPRPTRATENFVPVRADVLVVDLDHVSHEPQNARREAVVTRVLQRVRDLVGLGLLPVLFVPTFGIPQELVLGRAPGDPPLFVHEAILAGFAALKRAGHTLPEGLHPRKTSVLTAGHAVMLPEDDLRAYQRREGWVTLGFGAGGQVDERFPRFSMADPTDLAALVEAVAPKELVYVGSRVRTWALSAPHPQGVRVHLVEKEAQIGLL